MTIDFGYIAIGTRKMFEREKEGESIENMNKRTKKIARANYEEINLMIERERRSCEEEERSRIEEQIKQESRKSDNKNVDYLFFAGITTAFQRMEEE